MSLTDMLLEKMIPHYPELKLLLNLGIVAVFMLIARTVTRDWRVIVLAGVLGFLLAFGYLPV